MISTTTWVWIFGIVAVLLTVIGALTISFGWDNVKGVLLGAGILALIVIGLLIGDTWGKPWLGVILVVLLIGALYLFWLALRWLATLLTEHIGAAIWFMVCAIVGYWLGAHFGTPQLGIVLSIVLSIILATPVRGLLWNLICAVWGFFPALFRLILSIIAFVAILLVLRNIGIF